MEENKDKKPKKKKRYYYPEEYRKKLIKNSQKCFIFSAFLLAISRLLELYINI